MDSLSMAIHGPTPDPQQPGRTDHWLSKA